MIAYLDLIIIENFIMNFLMLYTTGKILCRTLCRWKISVASIIGVLYTFSLYINLPIIIINVSKVFMAAILMKISFNTKNIKGLIKETIVFLVISFIYAGCSLAFIYLFKPKVVYIVNGVIIGGNLVFEIVIFSAIVSFLLIKICSKFVKLKQRFTKKDMICNLKIVNGSKGIKIKAFIDTGNLLSDPISKSPVVVASFDEIKSLFSKECLNSITSLMNGMVINSETYDSKIRTIPYSSIGNNRSMMIAYKVDYIEIEHGEETKRIDDILIGLSKEKLTTNGQYSALIGLKIFERGNLKNESYSSIKDESKCGVC